MHGLLESIPGLSIVGNILLQNISYSIIEVKEEEVPLAPGLGAPYYYPMLAVMILLFCTVSMAVYLIICNGYRKRIKELDGENATHLGWRLWKLRSMVNELELQKAESLIWEMQENFQKNIKNAEPFFGEA